MNDIHFLDTECFLPYIVERGVYGSVKNINTLKIIVQVCKRWQQWVYTNTCNGPFYPLGANIKALYEKHASIGHLNLALQEQGMQWFNYIVQFGKNKIVKAPTNNFIFTLPQNYNIKGFSLMQRALNEVLKNENHLSLIDLLIDRGANINQPFCRAQNKQDEITPLAYVWLNGEEKAPLIADYLVSKHADIGTKFGPYNDNLLTYLSRPSFLSQEKGSIDYDNLCKWFLNKEGDLNYYNNKKETALHGTFNETKWWPFRENIFFAQALIDNGCDTSCVDGNGDHPIHLICHQLFGENRLLLGKHLLQKNPSEACAFDAQGNSPLFYCIQKGDLALAQEIVNHLDKKLAEDTTDNLLEAFLKFLKRDAFNQFLEKKIWYTNYLQLMSDMAKTIYLPLLECALRTNDQNQKRALLKGDHLGSTYLHDIAKNCPWLIGALRKKGDLTDTDLELCDSTGLTLKTCVQKTLITFNLAVACNQGNLKSAIKLCAKNPFWHFCDRHGCSFLHLTLEGYLQSPMDRRIQNYFKILKLLLANNANPNATDNKGNTPLHYATDLAEPKATIIILALLNAGANPAQTNAHGISPYARIANDKEWTIAAEAMRGACINK